MFTSLVSICSGLNPDWTARFAIANVPAHGSTNRVYPERRAVLMSSIKNFCSTPFRHPRNIAPGSIKNAIVLTSYRFREHEKEAAALRPSPLRRGLHLHLVDQLIDDVQTGHRCPALLIPVFRSATPNAVGYRFHHQARNVVAVAGQQDCR